MVILPLNRNEFKGSDYVTRLQADHAKERQHPERIDKIGQCFGRV
jgi:hypothetical protein